MSKPKFIIGIDEAGRGPLAGPVAVAAVLSPRSTFNIPHSNLRDSKKLTARQREEWFAWVVEHPDIAYVVTLVGAEIIDREGVVYACREGVARCLRKLGAPVQNTKVLLDGALAAPPAYDNQETIIKGDEREPAIALASIVAKVHRDKHMARLSKKYPHYGFEQHKGYGTKEHYRNIKKHGQCAEHRVSFLPPMFRI